MVFYGDSITEQGHYTVPTEVFQYGPVTRIGTSSSSIAVGLEIAYGAVKVGCLKSGSERDVIPLRPTVVTVMLGMNDGYYSNSQPHRCSKHFETNSTN